MEENAPTSKPTTRSVGMKFGFITALFNVVLFLVLVLTGQNAFDNKWSWIGIIALIVILVFAHKNFKDEGDGFMSYGQGIGIAFWITLVSVVIGALFTYVYSNIIDPAVMESFYDKQREAMEAKNMPDEQMEMAITWTKKLFWPMYVFFGFLFSILIALIVTIFTQKKSPESVI